MAGADDLEAAWAEVHAATPPGCYVGHPSQRHDKSWAVYAFDHLREGGHRPQEP
ncbi:MAG: hypothetical protein ABIP53_10510 [Candidatus Limnocylindrales bacterium]